MSIFNENHIREYDENLEKDRKFEKEALKLVWNYKGKNFNFLITCVEFYRSVP